MPRVRVHLRLDNPETRESVVKLVQQKGETCTYPTVAYATRLVLENVVPVIEEEKRAEIATKRGTKKKPCAYFEGDLIAWEGTLRETAELTPKLAAILAKQQQAILPYQHASLHLVQTAEGTSISFNPKVAAQFYPKGDMSQAFISAPTVIADHWNYIALQPQFRPMQPQEIEQNPLPESRSSSEILRKARVIEAAQRR